MTRKLFAFATSFFLWFLLAWPFATDGLDWQSVAAGAVISAFIAHFFADSKTKRPFTPTPARGAWALAYAAVFLSDLFTGALYSTARAFRPRPSSRVRLISVTTELRTPAALTVLSNAISLSPDAITVETGTDGTMTIALCSDEEQDSAAYLRSLVRRHQSLLARVFE